MPLFAALCRRTQHRHGTTSPGPQLPTSQWSQRGGLERPSGRERRLLSSLVSHLLLGKPSYSPPLLRAAAPGTREMQSSHSCQAVQSSEHGTACSSEASGDRRSLSAHGQLLNSRTPLLPAAVSPPDKTSASFCCHPREHSLRKHRVGHVQYSQLHCRKFCEKQLHVLSP